MLILILLALTVQEPAVIDCHYNTKRVVAQCPKGEIPIDWTKDAFVEWLLVPATRGGEVEFGGPIGERKPRDGDTLKIALATDGKWYALASCKVRQVRDYQRQKKLHEGQHVSMPSEQDDCQPWYKKQ